MHVIRSVARLVAVAWVAACGDGTSPDPGDTPIRLEFAALPPLSAGEGTFRAWTVDGGGAYYAAGEFAPGAGAVTVHSPIQDPIRLVVTVEPPGDADDQPSEHEILTGTFDGGVAALGIVGAITAVDGFEENPGHHALFTPSNNPEDKFPSREDAGIWVFAPVPSSTAHNNHFIWLTPLRRGWTYEGWIVHEYGTANECWISYGKFTPVGVGPTPREVNARDDTGLGIFSGQEDYVNALPFDVDMPGDDWVANIHGQPVPCGLTLPFDLNGNAANGIASPWTHAITVEPMFDYDEPPLAERPFVLRPYRNPFGEGPPNEGREIVFYPGTVPTGTATIVP